jgi:hypothetical protein
VEEVPSGVSLREVEVEEEEVSSGVSLREIEVEV